jgi:hypothetical protein
MLLAEAENRDSVRDMSSSAIENVEVDNRLALCLIRNHREYLAI